MIQVTSAVLVGNSFDEEHGNLGACDVGAVLNVAQDLTGTRSWADGTEYMQVGLVDGPGNAPAAYHAAVLALASLAGRHRVLVYDHDGGRALAVAIMYLRALAGFNRDLPLYWEDWLAALRVTNTSVPAVHECHRAAFGNMHWELLATVMGME